MMKSSFCIAALAGALVIGCGAPPKPVEPVPTATTTTQNTPSKPSKPALKALKIRDLVIGNGVVQGVKISSNPTVGVGDMVTAYYRGKLADGTVFESNYPTKADDTNPYVFTVGQADLIPGFSQGVIGMKVGGEREVDIPSALAYGPRASGPVPANSDLFFRIKVLDVVKVGEESYFDIKDLKIGSGPEAKPGDKLTIKFTGTLPSGQVFETHEKDTVSFKLGAGEAIAGFDAAVKGMRKGGVRLMRIPPMLGYMTKNVPGIPPNSTLIYKVTLVDIK